MNNYLIYINRRFMAEYRFFSEAAQVYQQAYEQYAEVQLLDGNTFVEIDISQWA